MKAAYPHCAERLFGRAHAIEPTAFRALIEGPAGRRILSGERIETGAAVDLQASRRKRMAMVEADPVSVANGCGEYALTNDGIAIVPVMGILSQRFDWLAALCGWTTYEGLTATFDAMLTDYRVRGILLDVDSPGGEAAGMVDCCDVILAAREVKPVWAVANTYAASAAYGVAGSASELWVPRLALVGSIGAVMVHVDQSQADEAYGERYTAVFAGARKIDGWPHAPLSEGAQSTMQKSVDHCRQVFADLVGRQGRIDSAAAIATEAGMYHDDDAVMAGLADRVGSFDDALQELTQQVSGSPRASAARSAAIGDRDMKTKASTKANSVQEPDERPVTAAATLTESQAPESTQDQVEAEAPAGDPLPPAGDPEADENEVCATCGRNLSAGAGAEATAGGDKVRAEVIEILGLCVTNNIDLKSALGFVSAKADPTTVRTQIAGDKASRADAQVTVTMQPQASSDSRMESWRKTQEKTRSEMGLGARK